MNGKSKASRKNESNDSPYMKIAVISIVSALLYFAILAAYAAFALKSGAGSSGYLPAGIISGALTGFLNGFIAVRPVKQKGALYGGLAGLLQAVLCCAVIFIINHGTAGNGIFILLAAITACGVFGGISAVNIKVKKKY